MIPPGPHVTIHYCPRCRWLMRSAWYAQELLTTFEGRLGAVTLIPAEQGGRFEVAVDGHTVWERKTDGGFPEAKVLKQRLRDRIAPEQSLGHADRAQTTPGDQP